MSEHSASSQRTRGPWRPLGVAAALALAVLTGYWLGDEDAIVTTVEADGLTVEEARSDEQDASPADAPDLATSDLATLVAAGHEQLERNSLTRPAGANAVETWLAALAREPLHPEVRAGLEATLQRLGAQVALYLDQSRLQNAHDLHLRARDFATRAGLTTEDVWRDYKQTVRDGLIAALERAADRHDRRRAERLAELAQEIDPDHPDLEPARERILAIPRRGDALPADGGPPMILVQTATDERVALAAMAREVTRGEYAAFVAATDRAPARCHNRLSLLQLFDRSQWNAPGFAQDDRHPVVCVSAVDAGEYAAWLSAQTGQRWRLPTAEEWRVLAGRRHGETCQGEHIDCSGAVGTVAADSGPASTLGLHGLHGNVAEWLAECAEDCTLQLTGGASWRDRPEDLADLQIAARQGDRGYDDVGFRLVRELGPTLTP